MKSISYLLLTVLFFLNSCNNKQGVQQNETNKNCVANVISKEQLADLLYSKKIDNVQFIDIRTPHQFSMGHLPGAINVPLKSFFDKKYFNKIPDDKILILYGNDASSPRLLALMYSHFNKANMSVALGGYHYIKSKILDNYGIYSGLYDDESPLVDYQQVINDIKSRSGIKITKNVKLKPSNKPVVKRKKEEVSGGCG